MQENEQCLHERQQRRAHPAVVRSRACHRGGWLCCQHTEYSCIYLHGCDKMAKSKYDPHAFQKQPKRIPKANDSNNDCHIPVETSTHVFCRSQKPARKPPEYFFHGPENLLSTFSCCPENIPGAVFRGPKTSRTPGSLASVWVGGAWVGWGYGVVGIPFITFNRLNSFN